MRHFKHIIIWAVIALGVAWQLCHWYFVDEGPAYFASDWRRLLFLAVISVGGGLATLAFMRLPDTARQRLTTTSFAIGTVSVTWCFGYFVWQFVRLRSFLAEIGDLWILALIGIGFLVLLAFVWFSFWRYCQRIYGHRHAA